LPLAILVARRRLLVYAAIAFLLFFATLFFTCNAACCRLALYATAFFLRYAAAFETACRHAVDTHVLICRCHWQQIRYADITFVAITMMPPCRFDDIAAAADTLFTMAPLMFFTRYMPPLMLFRFCAIITPMLFSIRVH